MTNKSNFEAIERRLAKQTINGTSILRIFTFKETVLNRKFYLIGYVVIVRNMFKNGVAFWRHVYVKITMRVGIKLKCVEDVFLNILFLKSHSSS